MTNNLPNTSASLASKHLTVGVGRIQYGTYTPAAIADALVSECLVQTEDRTVFPPKLFILWATPNRVSGEDANKPQVRHDNDRIFFDELLTHISDKLTKQNIFLGPMPESSDVSGTEGSGVGEAKPRPLYARLLGTSVAACVFDDKVVEQGAVLICLASRYLMVRAQIAPLNREIANMPPHEDVARSILSQLGVVVQAPDVESSPNQPLDANEKLAIATLTGLEFEESAAANHVRKRDINPSQYGLPYSSNSTLWAGLKPPSGGINPLNNQWLLLHVPAHPPLDFKDKHGKETPLGYLAADITESLVALTAGRIPMFGGGSSGGLVPTPGFQFFDVRDSRSQYCYSDHVVAALVETNLAFAIGLTHGLRRTGTHFMVKDLKDDHRTIHSFGGTHSLADIFDNVLPQPILGLPDIGSASDHTGEHYFTAIIPKANKEKDKLYLLRRIPEKASLQKMVADPCAMELAAESRRKLLVQSHDIDWEDVRCILGIGCVGRYRHRDRLALASSVLHPWSMKTAVRNWALNDLPAGGAKKVACFLDGEIGLDNAGNVRFNNFSYSELILSAAVPPPMCLRLAAQSIARYALDAEKPQSTNPNAPATVLDLKAPMDHVFRCLEDAGFRGGMISLKCTHNNVSHMVGKDAFGHFWKEIVMPNTQRPLQTPDGKTDILCRVKAGLPIFVHDVSQTDLYNCDSALASEAHIKSFYVYALTDPDNNVYGTLQIDLGDKSSWPESDEKGSPEFDKYEQAYKFPPRFLPKDYRDSLNALGAIISSLLFGVLRKQQMELYDWLGDRFAESICNPTIEEAFTAFSKHLCDYLKSYSVCCHLRFYNKTFNSLMLTAGYGPYFDNAQRDRFHVSLDAKDNTTTYRVFTDERLDSVVENNAANQSNKDTLALKTASPHVLEGIHVGSFATFALRHDYKTTKCGVFCVMSEKEWLFVDTFMGAFKRICGRLATYYSLMKRFQCQYNDASISIFKYHYFQYVTKASLHTLNKLKPEGLEQFCTSLERHLGRGMTGSITMEPNPLDGLLAHTVKADNLSARVAWPKEDERLTKCIWICNFEMVTETLKQIFLNAVEASPSLTDAKPPVEVTLDETNALVIRNKVQNPRPAAEFAKRLGEVFGAMKRLSQNAQVATTSKPSGETANSGDRSALQDPQDNVIHGPVPFESTKDGHAALGGYQITLCCILNNIDLRCTFDDSTNQLDVILSQPNPIK